MIIFKLNLFQDEVPSALMDAHVKNIEAATTDGKYDPAVGLLQVMNKSNFIKQNMYVIFLLLFRVVLRAPSQKKKKKMKKKKRNQKMSKIHH